MVGNDSHISELFFSGRVFTIHSHSEKSGDSQFVVFKKVTWHCEALFKISGTDCLVKQLYSRGEQNPKPYHHKNLKTCKSEAAKFYHLLCWQILLIFQWQRYQYIIHKTDFLWKLLCIQCKGETFLVLSVSVLTLNFWR